MWVARDIDGNLYIYTQFPHLNEDTCYWSVSNVDDYSLSIDKSLFPELKWNDDPIEVDILKKRKLLSI